MGSRSSKEADEHIVPPPTPPVEEADEQPSAMTNEADATATEPKASSKIKEKTSPNGTDETHRWLKSFLNPDGIVSKSDEDLLRQTRPANRSQSCSTFSTSSLYLNSLTNSKTKSDQHLSSALDKNELDVRQSNTKIKQESSLEKAKRQPTLILPSRVYSKKGDNYPPNLDHGHITYHLDENVFASNYAYFSSFFDKQNQTKCPQETEPDEISYDQALVQNFLSRSHEISSRTNKLCQLSKSKLQPNINSRKKIAPPDSLEKCKVAKSNSSSSKSVKSAARTYSRLSVDSEKTIYHYQKASKSPNLSKKSSLNSNDSLRFREKVTRSPSVTTPAEVMVRGYVFYRRVASGSFSNLFECTCFSMPNLELACKHIRTSEFVANKACLKDFLLEEIEIMQRVNHPNVITMYEIVSTPMDVYIFMKFAINGTIFDYLYKEWRKPLPETYAKRWMKHLMSGLEYVHGLKIVHRDLKLENFLLDDKYTALLSDFGLAVQLSSTNAQRLLSVHCGTQDYMAPELNMAATISTNSFYDPFPADIYAMGVCLFEMVNYYRPFAISLSESEYSIVYRQQHRKYQLNKRIFLEKECQDLLNLLLEPKPSLRPKATTVLTHIWFQVQKR